MALLGISAVLLADWNTVKGAITALPGLVQHHLPLLIALLTLVLVVKWDWVWFQVTYRQRVKAALHGLGNAIAKASEPQPVSDAVNKAFDKLYDELKIGRLEP